MVQYIVKTSWFQDQVIETQVRTETLDFELVHVPQDDIL